MAKQYIEQRSGATATNSVAPLQAGAATKNKSLASASKVVNTGKKAPAKLKVAKKRASSSGKKMMKVSKPRPAGTVVSAPSVTKNINRKIY